MHPVVNHLIQLQELILIRHEEKVTMGIGRLEQMDLSIREMTAKLPLETKSLFEKLNKKDPVVIVPISESICAACGMKLPISLIQAVRLGRDIHGCPNCARMLFFPESAARWVGQTPKRSGYGRSRESLASGLTRRRAISAPANTMAQARPIRPDPITAICLSLTATAASSPTRGELLRRSWQ